MNARTSGTSVGRGGPDREFWPPCFTAAFCEESCGCCSSSSRDNSVRGAPRPWRRWADARSRRFRSGRVQHDVPCPRAASASSRDDCGRRRRLRALSFRVFDRKRPSTGCAAPFGARAVEHHRPLAAAGPRELAHLLEQRRRAAPVRSTPPAIGPRPHDVVAVHKRPRVVCCTDPPTGNAPATSRRVGW